MAVKRSVLYVAVPQTAVLLFMGHICVAKSRPSLRTTSVRGCVGGAGPALPVSAQSRILNVFFTFLALFFFFFLHLPAFPHTEQFKMHSSRSAWRCTVHWLRWIWDVDAGCCQAAPPSPCIRQWRLLHDIKYLSQTGVGCKRRERVLIIVVLNIVTTVHSVVPSAAVLSGG